MIKRYSAKLLFQFKVVINNNFGKRRVCEERIIVFYCETPELAFVEMNKRGKQEEFDYINNDGNPVFFEFIGIQDLLELGVETREDEVWYDIKEYLMPMERKNKLIPNKNKLSVFKN